MVHAILRVEYTNTAEGPSIKNVRTNREKLSSSPLSVRTHHKFRNILRFFCTKKYGRPNLKNLCPQNVRTGQFHLIAEVFYVRPLMLT